MMVTGILSSKGIHAFDHETRTPAGHRVVPHIWVIVADREQAHIYRKTPDGLELIARAHAKGKQVRSFGEHIFSSQNLEVQSSDSHYKSPHHMDMLFIRRLVEWLNVAEKEKSFDQLILVAAPYTLGNIRSCLTRGLEKKVCGTLNKELTRMSAAEVREHLRKVKRLWVSIESLGANTNHSH